ncbi:MAG: OadG family protein [Clostridia bacterium]|nr:OadG family protein [Clostridia bacterium]
MKMPITEALTIAVIGICVVMMILAIIAVLIILLSKVIRAIEKLIAKKTPAPAAPQPVPAAVVTDREVELIGTDEKTAAVIMAIVSKKSDIPLEKLSFKSIRLMDNDEKGGNK